MVGTLASALAAGPIALPFGLLGTWLVETSFSSEARQHRAAADAVDLFTSNLQVQPQTLSETLLKPH